MCLQAAQLVEKIRLLGGLVIKDRTYHFKTYKTCFVGEHIALYCTQWGGVKEFTAGGLD